MEEKIKLIIWDCDMTLIDGVLSENDHCSLNPNMFYLVKKFDEIGVLQSICSRNDFQNVKHFLDDKNVGQYFLHNSIDWGMKSAGVTKIVHDFNLLDKNTIFIDDQIFEREEVQNQHPMIRVMSPNEAYNVFNNKFFSRVKVTKESSRRRQMYVEDLKRKNVEDNFGGDHDEFLKSLGMKLVMRCATLQDLDRVFELFERTHQLNSTGIMYKFDELKQKVTNLSEKVLVLELEDKYGEYGIIGILVLKKEKQNIIIEQFLLSCRIMSRGVGGFVLKKLNEFCLKKNYILMGLYRKTEYNRIMEITYKFNGFKKYKELPSGVVVYECKNNVIEDEDNQVFDFQFA